MSKKNIPNYIRKQRGDWGAINPVTKVIPNKKRNYIPDEYDEYYSIDDCNRDIEDSIDIDEWSDY